MSKYIIELDENAKEVVVISLEDGDMWTETMEVEDLEQLNSDYINEHFGDLQDTAYQKGFEDGKKFSVGEAVKRAEYDKGLEDAWECVKKLYLNGMSKELFGRYFNAFIQEYSARQAIEMLKAHEQKKADKIGVGDVVETKSGTIFAVTKITADGLVVGFTGDGSTCCFNITKLTKTGGHYNINEILGGLCDD